MPQLIFYLQTLCPEESVYLLKPFKHLLQLILSLQISQFSEQLVQNLNFKIPYHAKLEVYDYLKLMFALLDEILLLICICVLLTVILPDKIEQLNE